MIGSWLLLVGGCTLLTQDDWDQRLDPDGDGVAFPADCDDRDDTIGAPTELHEDADGDGYGSKKKAQRCLGLPGWTRRGGDCDDAEPLVHPGGVEVCNGVDDDCSGAADDGLPFKTYYQDNDGDGFGDRQAPRVVACAQPTGYSSRPGDCDDTDAAAFPANPEVCDGVDNDCDLQTDENLRALGAPDLDGDGFGDASQSTSMCLDDPAYAPATDCDDADPGVYPGAPEDCSNGVDEGCRGFAEGDTMYVDADGDGHGDPTLPRDGCPFAADLVAPDDDCDDTDAAIFPGATENCADGVDNDCDGQVDGIVQWRDRDGDGTGNSRVRTTACSLRAGWATNDLDCDDTTADEPAHVDPAGLATGTGHRVSPVATLDQALALHRHCVVMHAGSYPTGTTISGDLDLRGDSAGDVRLTGLASACDTAWPVCAPVLAVTAGTVSLTGITIAEGGGEPSVVASGDDEARTVCGGGLYVTGGSVGLTDVAFADNVLPEAGTGTTSTGGVATLTSAGGGLCAVGGAVSLTDVTFVGNAATLGGALYVTAGATVTGERVAFSGNAAEEGAAAWIGDGSLALSQARSWCNDASQGGAAFWLGVPYATLSLQFVDLVGDTAANGPAEVWAADGAAVDLDSFIVVGDDPAFPAVDGDGSVRARYGLAVDAAGVAFGNARVDSTVLAAATSPFAPTCNADATDDVFSLPAGSPAVDAGVPSLLDVDGSRADAGSDGGPGGAW